MITARFEKDKLTVEGTIEKGDVYSDLCCQGYNFTVVNVIAASVLGYCDSPNHRCSDHSESEICSYCGSNVFGIEDIILFVAERKHDTQQTHVAT